jgi:hypothetical protein
LASLLAEESLPVKPPPPFPPEIVKEQSERQADLIVYLNYQEAVLPHDSNILGCGTALK